MLRSRIGLRSDPPIDWAKRFRRWATVLRELHEVTKAIRATADELARMKAARATFILTMVAISQPGAIAQEVITLLGR